MKAYESVAGIAAASPDEIARRCRLSLPAAKAARAAARLALEDGEARKETLESAGRSRKGTGRNKTLALAKEALASKVLSAETAAEPEADYGGEEINGGL
jgi:hypothetical protein